MSKIRTLIMASALAATALISSGEYNSANACSRVVYTGDSSLIIVGRSLDWKTPIPTNLYVYPRGMEKVADNKPNAVRWTSKYGAVYAVGYDGGITEGMNEKGLVINGLFCKGTIYENKDTQGRPAMSLAVFVGWLLDTSETTAEVVEKVRKRDFSISGATFDGGTVSTLHWGVTDREGNCAVIEFDHGNVDIYEGRDLPVLTNDPTWPKINAINDYWKNVGGQNMLPGTVKSPDRFVRASYFDSHVGKTADAALGVAVTRSIVANVSVPYTYTIETEPNVSSTQWRSYANLRDNRYYFDIVTNLGLYYIDLNKCDFRKGAKVMKLDTSAYTELAGEANKALRPSAPFTPMFGD